MYPVLGLELWRLKNRSRKSVSSVTLEQKTDAISSPWQVITAFILIYIHVYMHMYVNTYVCITMLYAYRDMSMSP